MIPGRVLAAFGLAPDIPIRPMGRVVAAGNLVLKPVDDEAEATWVAEALASLPEDGFRIAPPVQSVDGRWVVDGWSATEKIAGRNERRWEDILAAGDAFHAATASLERPEMLDRRTHVWARADRMAWGEQEPQPSPLADRLRRYVRPVDLPSQVVHGDLGGNVLFADALPPAVIDFSPYWRPPAWALAVVVVDAVVWHHAPVDLAEEHDAQVLARASLFRLYCDEPPRAHERWVEHLVARL